MFRNLMENVDNMHEWLGDFIIENETGRRSHMKILK